MDEELLRLGRSELTTSNIFYHFPFLRGAVFAIRSYHLASKAIRTQAPAVEQISRVKLPEHGYAVHRLRLKLSPALSVASSIIAERRDTKINNR